MIARSKGLDGNAGTSVSAAGRSRAPQSAPGLLGPSELSATPGVTSLTPDRGSRRTARRPVAASSDDAYAAGTASCGQCNRRWTGTKQAHCAGCCAHFGSVSTFDKHRVGDMCHHPADVYDKKGRHVFVTRHGAFGATWVTNYHGQRPAHWDEEV